MDFQFWGTSPNPSTMINSTSQSGAFPASVSSYFRKPSKIVKPTSRTNSPRSSGRRRMTTTGHFPSRPRSVVDQPRASMPQFSNNQNSGSRPISWHPHSIEEMNYQSMSFQPIGFNTTNFPYTPYTTAEVNGLITPITYPVVDEPQIHELITPLEELSAHDTNIQYDAGQNFSMTEYWLSQQQPKDIQNDSNTATMCQDLNYQNWYEENQYLIPHINTAPASPHYLPVPDFGASMTLPEQEVEIEKEELVGMGLYDSPAEVQSSSLLFGGECVKRKSLKLEDAFEPSPDSEDEEEDCPSQEDSDLLDDVNTSVAVDVVGNSIVTEQPYMNYSYMMNDNLMINEWQMQKQAAQGWI